MSRLSLAPVPAMAGAMANRRHTLARETGIALAVLAMYVLTLLLPLHSAAGLQRDLNALGFSNLASWSVCSSIANDRDTDPTDPAALTCPATGVAKSQLTAVLPPAITIEVPEAHALGNFVPSILVAAGSLPAHFGQSRAPPALV
ncbi:hypothetical protein JHC09_05970 [Devosia sp. MC532]|uniref:hypothetical protein n=1 Tax=Devosia sp. MC532 TaxID=2799788 RepID=UPI0018F33261|nr:hypothetical protein [Devosia sp. MC532]MBJ7577429.1 hypothetical protein [Devosia sp. MC532]